MGGLSINQDSNIEEIRKEYRSLKWRAEKRIDPFEFFMWVIHPVLTISVTIIAAFSTRDGWSTFLAFVLAVYIPGAFVSMILSGLIEFAVGKRLEQYLENRRITSSWYPRYQFLHTYITEYEEAERIRLAEEKRIRLIPIRSEVKRIQDEVAKIEEAVRLAENIIWRKRKWYAEYREYEASIRECVLRLEDLEGQGQLTRARFGTLAEEVSYAFYSLFRLIAELEQRCRATLTKMQGMKDWTPPVQIRTSSRPSKNTTTPDRPSAPNHTIHKTSPSGSADSTKTAEGDVKEPVVVVPPPPPKRRVLDRELKTIPFEDYVGAAKAKMTIGELGEIVVLHYEIRRVEAEIGRSGVGIVTRVSEHTGNAGYDIESFSQGDRVFIEVKSTSGPCWTDFFLSANEKRVMEKLGEKYWLYRIFELSKEDGSAKLSIFRGRAEIEASLELEAANYRINPKPNPDGNPTLPFETLH